MTDRLPMTGSGKPRAFAGSGWIDGACNEPEYNPRVLVDDVQALLVAKGLHVRVDQETAVIAAADLLRALSVAPSSAPWDARRTPQGG